MTVGPTNVPVQLFPGRFGALEFTFLLRTGSLEWLRRHMLVLGELELLRAGLGVQTLRVLDSGGAQGPLAAVQM